MEISTTISAEFVTSSIGSKFTFSKKTIFGEFLWTIQVTKRIEYLAVYLDCQPIHSTKEWMCKTSFSLIETSSGTKGTDNYKFSSYADNLGWGWTEFMPWEDLAGSETFTIQAAITIEDSYLGPPNVNEATSNQVIFHRVANDFSSTKTQTSRHNVNDSNWLVEGQKSENGTKFVVKRYNKEGKLELNLPSGAVVVTVKGPSSIETKSGDLGEAIWFEKEINVESVVTFLIHDEPSPEVSTDVAKGFNFGREYLSHPTHGNKFIEEEGELDHDVSDFDAQSVQIFIDACYSGTLEMLSDTTEFKVFSDFLKMVGVFKVEWAKKGCHEFFITHLPKPYEDFRAYWDYALLALDSAVKYEDWSFLDHLLSCTQKI
eukprot:sb/3465789/